LEIINELEVVTADEIGIDHLGKIWLATDAGLGVYDEMLDSSIYIDASPGLPTYQKTRMVLGLEIDPSGSLWLGSIRGLAYYEPAAQSAKLLREEDGLIGNQVNSLELDLNGKLWLATHKGLSFYNPETADIRNFDQRDGIAGKGFNRRAGFQDAQGNIYFGSDRGTVYFHPDSVKLNVSKPVVFLTNFRIFNENVPIQQADSTIQAHDFVLEKPIWMLEEIRIPYHHRMLTFGFVALNYLSPDKNQYAYMMEGFDEKWIQAGTDRTATYTNLSPGTYTFRVKASNNDGIWNEEGCSLKIIIDPPWYLTYWAFVAYGMLIFSLFGLYLYYRVRQVAREYETQARIARAKSEERELVRKRSSQDFHDEAGNKLTKLSLYTELGKRKASDDPEMLSFFQHIERNVRELATGMRDFIWVLDPEQDTLADTLNRLKDFGEQLFVDSETNYTYQIDFEQFKAIPLSIKSKRHLLLIFKEVMNNCLKYASASEAKLYAFTEGNSLQVVFEDNGKGFDPPKQRSGNGLKNMLSRAAEMNGKIDIQSTPEVGTKVLFDMQITHMGDDI